MAMKEYEVVAQNIDIEKPLLDDRKYRFIKLKNGLHALVVSDADTDLASASLDVNVGSFIDKEYNVPGLAHFCEHLLFMGTEKYPEENEYSKYLSKNSGFSNAYTASEHTNYYFEVGSDYLEGALDRFAQFFIQPLFSKSVKDREIRAVDSENKKNLQDDNWRLYQLDKSTSNPAHPYNGFSTGNIQTLGEDVSSRGLDVRDILLKFYKEHYSANLMNLVVLGKEDLDTLSDWVSEMFASVSNKNLPPPFYGNTSILSHDQLGSLIKAKPITVQNTIQVAFQIPDDQEENWSTSPSDYYSHLLGHESSGSIFYYLREKGYATELSAGGARKSQGNSVFMINVELTPSGLSKWEEILITIFEYLNLVLNMGPQKWIWEEIHKISQIDFKFSQKQRASSTTSGLSSKLYKFSGLGKIPPQFLLSYSINRDFSPEHIVQYGKYLNSDNYRVTLVSQELNNLNQKEKWYGTEYSIESLPSNLVNAIGNIKPNNALRLPEKNRFIPENFTVFKKRSENPLLYPHLLTHDNKYHIWFKQDDRFEVPKEVIKIEIHLPQSCVDSNSWVNTLLLCEYLEDDLNDVSYYASMVGLGSFFYARRGSIFIEVRGYNDKISLLLEQILSRFSNFVPNESRFKALKFKLLKALQEFAFSSPFRQMLTHFNTLVNEKVYSNDEQRHVLNKIDFADFKVFATEKIWKSGIFVEALIHGNLELRSAELIRNLILEKTSKFSSISNNFGDVFHAVKLGSYVLPPNSQMRHELPVEDPENINSCIEYYIQISPDLNSLNLNVLTDLLSTIIHEPCFDQLRTKEQLGYVVFSRTRVTRNSLGFKILVQSERATDYLEYRISEFLEWFSYYINEELTDEQFLEFKGALINQKLQKLNNLREESVKLFSKIGSGYYDFTSELEEVAILEKTSRKSFVKFYNEYVRNDLEKSSRVCLHLKSQRVPQQPRTKLMQAAIYNFFYREGIKVESAVIDEILSDYDYDLDTLVNKLAKEVIKTGFNNLNSDYLPSVLLRKIKEGVKSPVPKKFPTGKLIDSIGSFKKSCVKGEVPLPKNDLADYYYEHSDHAHL